MGETRLFVSNIPPNTTEQELQNEFGFYGVVKKVDLKSKNDQSFGFVNIEIDEKLVDKCIREFGKQQFKGTYLSISRAKESFLERLKREREEALHKPAEIVEEHYEEEEEYYEPLPEIKSKHISSDESSSEEEEEVKPVVPFKVVKKTNGYSTARTDIVKEISYEGLDKNEVADLKRVEGLKKMQNLHDEQKRAIKNALLSIDGTSKNKIVFEAPEKPVVVEASLKQSNKKGKLFDEDEDEDMDSTNFKVKNQFAGKNGEKLFELQTRYQNDKRFAIDDKFADEVEEDSTELTRYTREQLKERKKLRKEMENWDQNEMKDERDHQLSILDSVTGETTNTQNNFLKPAHKAMLRYDPSKKGHMKYLDLVRDDDVDMDVKNKEVYTVSDEKFYEADGLAKSLLQKPESKPFSIFEMLGVNHEEEPEEDQSKKVDSNIVVKSVVPVMSQVKFKYDSSDTDDDAEDAKMAKKKKLTKTSNKNGKYSKTGVWRPNFFVVAGDKRLKDAFAFIKTTDNLTTEQFEEKRKKLKGIIKSKIRKAKSDKNRSEKFAGKNRKRKAQII